VVTPSGMKRRRRGPRGSAFFNFADENLRHMESQLSANAPAENTADKDNPVSSSAGRMQNSAYSRPPPADTVHGDEDSSMASQSDGDGTTSEDTAFSSEGEVLAGRLRLVVSSCASPTSSGAPVLLSGSMTLCERPRTRLTLRKSGRHGGDCSSFAITCCSLLLPCAKRERLASFLLEREKP